MSQEDFPDDINKMETLCVAHGLDYSRDQIRDAWERYSESLCASWINPDPDDFVIATLRAWVTV